jgi:glycine/D-amino acid oxidase-like deaminating enzyme
MAEARSLELDGATNRPKSVGVVDRSGVESTLPADEVVIAAGPWTGELSKKVSFLLCSFHSSSS